MVLCQCPYSIKPMCYLDSMDFDGSMLVFIFNAASAPFGFSEPDMHTYTQQMVMALNESVLLSIFNAPSRFNERVTYLNKKRCCPYSLHPMYHLDSMNQSYMNNRC